MGLGGSVLRRLVLIADRDDEERAVLAGLLERAGFDVVEAASGDDALTLAQESALSLVILEVPLPGMSGYEVCRALREERGKDIPVLFLSGARTESYDRVAGLSLGADDYLVKPYAPEELLARIRRLVAKPRPNPADRAGGLTPRELEILQLLAGGQSPDTIAGDLFISTKTVATHIEHIFVKLNVHSRVEAVAVAYRDGLVGGVS
jgi:DNA-binding NarL/FixJ family response regulator